MSNEMEQIEARLAAYIDGTLPPDQKSEIEAYLAANPGHERLISELKSIKAAVANLPREKAPAEVMDGVQAQLERAVLLENMHDPSAAVRVSRWPQLGAVAAMLLLTGGLGLLVYQVLPQQKTAGPDYALLPDATRPTVPDSELPDTPIVLDAPASRPLVLARTREPGVFRDVELAPAASQESLKLSPAPVLANVASAAVAATPATAPGQLAMASASITSEAAAATTAPAALATSMPSDAGDRATPAAPVTLRLVVVQTDDPLLARNLWAAHAASTGHAVRSGIGPALQTSGDAAVLTPSPIGPGEPYLVVSDVVLPAPTTRPFAEADSARLFDAMPPATQPLPQTQTVQAMTFTAATLPASQPAVAVAAPTTGDLLAVFRPKPAAPASPARPPAASPATNRPSTQPARLP